MDKHRVHASTYDTTAVGHFGVTFASCRATFWRPIWRWRVCRPAFQPYQLPVIDNVSLLSPSSLSALEVYTIMRYINPHFTYLLTYLTGGALLSNLYFQFFSPDLYLCRYYTCICPHDVTYWLVSYWLALWTGRYAIVDPSIVSPPSATRMLKKLKPYLDHA